MKQLFVLSLFFSFAMTTFAQEKVQQKQLSKSRAEYYVKNDIPAWRSRNGQRSPLDSFYTFSTLTYVELYAQEKRKVADQYVQNSDSLKLKNLSADIDEFVSYVKNWDEYHQNRKESMDLYALQFRVQKYTRELTNTMPKGNGDKIHLHKGEWILAKVVAIDASGVVSFKYKGEDVVNYVSSNSIEEIVFESGRTQKMSNYVEVYGPDDWKKVKLVNSISEVAGLQMIDEASTRKVKWGLKRDMAKVDEKMRINIQKKAAELGAPFVLITDKAVESGAQFTDVFGPYSISKPAGNGYMHVVLYKY